MHTTLTRDFYVPKDARPVDCAGSDAAVYIYEVAHQPSGKIHLYAIGFHGKAQKPDFHYRYSTEQGRADAIARYIAGRKARAETMARQKAERTRPHTLKVGDVLYTSWGYDQTNVEFFEVTAVVGPHTVTLREVAQDREETHYMQGRCSARRGAYLSPRFDGDDQGLPITRRANANNCVRIDDVRTAWPWDGRPKSWSSYG